MRPLTRRSELVVGGLGVAAGLGAAAALLWGGYSVPPDVLGPTLVLYLAVPWAFIGAGLAAWRQRPDSRIGLLMVVFGFVFLAHFAIAIDTPATYVVGLLVGGVNIAVQTQIMATYPSGRLTTWPQRLIVAIAYLLSAPRALVLLLLGAVPRPTGPLVPDLLILAQAPRTSPTFDDPVVRAFALVLSAALLGVAAGNWRRAGPARQRALAPAMAGGAVIIVAFVALVLAGAAGVPPEALATITWLENAALLAWPAALLYGLVRSRLDRAAIGPMIIELGAGLPDPDRLRAVMAETAHDPTLQLALWAPVQGRYVDGDGREVDVDRLPAGRAVTRLERDGVPIAALVHDTALAAEPDLIGAVAAGAGLAVENDQLHAAVEAQLAEVQASRARIVAAGDAARRRVERDLHDGAQQRLVGVAVALRLARAQLGDGAGGGEPRSAEVAGLLDEAAAELTAALAELRELARGIYPAVLTDGGLDPALRSLADRSPIPVLLGDVPGQRLPAPVEQTAYFLVSEALTNAAKHARASKATVTVTARPGTTVVEIDDDGAGGARPEAGSGLRGMADRVAAVGGTLLVDSPPGRGTRVVARLPCG